VFVISAAIFHESDFGKFIDYKLRIGGSGVSQPKHFIHVFVLEADRLLRIIANPTREEDDSVHTP
jgi:hypothetical protein